jgi:pimeloyl-ACP methyl ester carboxylesterase
MKSKTLMFIHGMYMNNRCWEDWTSYFQDRGYKYIAPAWPGRDQPLDVLRTRHPDANLGELTLNRVVDHYTAEVKSLGEKPIIIGHSMGGLIVQLLLQQNLAFEGIAIDSAPPLGVFTAKWSFL